MTRAQKKQIEEFLKLLRKAHQAIKKEIEKKNDTTVMDLLQQCQDGAIQVGEMIDNSEGEGSVTIPLLENYCEVVYQVYEELGQTEKINVEKIYKKLDKALVSVENCVRNNIPVRTQAVFLPYKASMWDSLESIWMAADADPDCDAYVIPIPYYDKNPDGSFAQMHYEGELYPDYVPVIDYNDYNFEQYPDMIFIHNPYDESNIVTSVHPFFYSKNLKSYTDNLVYVPYYSTTGGMSEGQKYCRAYYYSDYIVIQAEKYRKFFDPALEQDKLVALGSPKFDRVMRICQNPPEPPEHWKAKMEGKKVYFYNTSLDGMLSNTQAFLKKMEYVFRCFENRSEACLVWRPHPLMESTFDSMRTQYKPFYNALKEYYIKNDLGIYDDTPDIANTIALCDAYVGDAGTSVTSLFGMAGKPLFILDNNINSKPQKDDWKGSIIRAFYPYGNDEWIVTQGNQLYHSEENNYEYKYFCNLSEYAYGDYYSQVITINGKNYVCPQNAQDILILGEKGIAKKIELKRCVEQPGAFYGAVGCGKYLFLIPNNYPAIVRYDTEADVVDYYEEHLDVFVKNVQGERRLGGSCVHKGYLFIGSPTDSYVLAIHAESGKQQVMTTLAKQVGGCLLLISDGDELWFLPYTGKVVCRWNPESGMVQEYSACPKSLQCNHPILGYACDERPFARPAFSGDYVYLPPCWGNKYICLNKQTGEMVEWIPPFGEIEEIKNGYYIAPTKSRFLYEVGGKESKIYRLFSIINRKLYDINLETNEWQEIKVRFDLDELKAYEPGFKESSDWFQYACQENASNSLSDFLDNDITGNAFNKERQIAAFGKIAANHDGTSGQKIYEFVRGKLES